MNRKMKVITAVLLVLCGFWVSASLVLAGDRVAKDGDVVNIHYTGKLEDQSVFDSSKDRDPLQFTLGDKNIIKGMNAAVNGMKEGEEKTVSIPPEEAYGPYSDKLVFEVPSKNLPAGVKPGTPLRDPQGGMVIVKDIQGEKATLDANHLLAGKTLTFEIKLVSIADATPKAAPAQAK